MDKELTINYSRIVTQRTKAVLIDLGEGGAVWFPKQNICIDESEYTIAGPKELIIEKLSEARGESDFRSKHNDGARVSLPPAIWENEQSIGINVIVCRLSGGGKVKKRIFFPKSQIDEAGTVPVWLVKAKEKAAIKAVADSQWRYTENDFIVRLFEEQGLLKDMKRCPEASK